jgi:hypothetical protein
MFIAAIRSADIAIVSVITGAITPPIGGFLLVIRWIVKFQRDITESYRKELFETRKEFDDYKLATETKFVEMNAKIDALAGIVDDEKDYTGRVIAWVEQQGLEIPDNLDRRKITA